MKQFIRLNERKLWIQDLIMGTAILLILAVFVGAGFAFVALLHLLKIV